MKKLFKRSISLVVVAVLLIAMCFTNVSAAGTGYTKAEQVVYKNSGNYIYNWGARDEVCVFLSTKAQSFYTGDNTFAKLSQNKGGTTQTNAPQSTLYSKLQSFMKSNHKYINAYKENNTLLKYTDCVQNNTSQISSFYSGKMFSNVWDSAKTWNKEHTWPNSKGLNGSDEDDVMMIRPTIVSENSSRGNTAYGESSGYFNPGNSVKGDCARIALYVYCRWGNTGKMWGSSGVIENLTVLLKWMEEDPVDTWEMGRNDAVQAITGTRNVFVDYPEFAWLLFGKSVPTNMTTPSGAAKSMSGNQGGNNDSNDNQGSNNNQDSNTNNNDTNSDSNSNTNSNNSNNNSTNNENNTQNNTNSDNTNSGSNESTDNSNQGGITNKPNNGGKPFDPNNIGTQQVQTNTADSGVDMGVVIAIIAGSVVIVCGLIITIIVIKKKRAK